jgi:hypothetical protein
MMRMRVLRYGLVWKLMLLVVLLFCVSHVSADMIETGKKNINVHYKLMNSDSYPEYVFLVYTFAPMIGCYSIINSDEEFGGYKFSSALIYAIRASEYEKIQIGDSDKSVQEFFETNPYLLASNVQLTFIGKKVPDIDPLVDQIIILEIVECTQRIFTLRISSIHYRYSDGAIEEVTYQINDVTPVRIHPSDLPEPLSRKVAWAWYCIIPLAALCGVVILRKAGKLGGVSR